MAIIKNGVLGNTTGKIGGVVGGKWKDKNYLRTYVIPANPNSVGQQAQRGKMSAAVAFAKLLTGQIFNVYTDGFQKSMSGFNAFIKANVAYFASPVVWASLKITEGKLYFAQGGMSTYSTVQGKITVHNSDGVGSNGLPGDKVMAFAYNKVTGVVTFAAAEALRSDASIEIFIGSGHTATDYITYSFAIQKTGNMVSLLSNSLYATVS
jgi:hypothetical protein